MHTLYLISGLGADERLFKNLKLNFPTKPIKWISLLENEQLDGYALRLAEQIDKTQPFSIIGVSFGGMCAVQISKVLNPVYTILISSSKTRNELPFIIKTVKFIPVHKLLTDHMFIQLGYLSKRLFGIRNPEQSKLFLDMLKSMPINYYSRSVNAIAGWKNKEYPDGIYHLHGDNDFIIPFNKIQNPIRIKGGSHLMVLDQANEISEIINGFLK